MSQPIDKSSTAAVILAGGHGERLGGVLKANITIGEATLFELVAGALGSTVRPLLIALGRHDPSLFNLSPLVIPIPDPVTNYGGPLLGLAAAIAWLSETQELPEFLISVAVDTPDFPPDFGARTKAIIGEKGGVIGCYEGQSYPTNALWRTSAIRTLPERLAHGSAPHSLNGLALELGAIPMDWSAEPSNPFKNINSLQDLEAAKGKLPVSGQPTG